MKTFIFITVSCMVGVCLAKPAVVSRQCATEDDKTAVGRCLRPWLNMWETMRAQEAISSELHFPVLYYSRAGVLGLCERYLQIRDDCLTTGVLRTCKADPMIAFVQSHMSYFCGNEATFALSKWDCVTKAVSAKPKCRSLIKGVPLPNRQSRKCLGIPKFFRCMEPEMTRRCGDAGAEILENSIQAFGCSLNSEENVIPAAKTREDREMDRMVKTINIDDVAAEEVDDESVEKETTTTTKSTTSTASGIIVRSSSTSNEEENDAMASAGNRLFEIVAEDPRGTQAWEARTRGDGLRVTSGSAETVGERWVQRGAPADIGAPGTTDGASGTLFEIVDSVRANPWAGQEAGAGIVVGETEIVGEPSLDTKGDNSQFQIVDDPRNGRIDPWKGTTPGKGLQFGAVTQRPSPRVAGTRRPSDESTTPWTPEHHRLFDVDTFQRKPIVSDVRGRGLIVADSEVTQLTADQRRRPPQLRPLSTLTKDELRAFEREQTAQRAADEGRDFFIMGESASTTTTKSTTTTVEDLGDDVPTTETTDATEQATDGTTSTTEAETKGTTRSAASTTAEEETSTTDAATTSVTKPAVFRLPELEGECTPDAERKIIQCLGPLSSRWDEIHSANPMLRHNYFPLFNYTASETDSLCTTLQNTIADCLDLATVAQCATHEVVVFVNDMLGYACGPEKADFFLAFDCIHMSHERHIGCLELLAGENAPGLSTRTKCAKVPNYVSCLRDDIDDRCGEDAVRIWLESVKNMGCERGLGKIPQKPVTVTKAPRSIATNGAPSTRPSTTSTTRKATTSKSTTDSTRGSTTSTTRGTTRGSTGSIRTTTQRVVQVRPLIRNQGDDAQCTDRLRHTARKCLLPVMEKWSSIVESKDKFTLPHFSYTKAEWLELCDGYANAFLCGGFNPFQRCISDDFVRYANDHLGYVCSPQNLPKYIMNYDCVTRIIEHKGDACTQFIRGQSTPGNDAHRCQGVGQFGTCIGKDVQFACGRQAVQLVADVIDQYGCIIGKM